MDATRSGSGCSRAVLNLTAGLRRSRTVIVVTAVALLVTACGSAKPASSPTTTKATVPVTAPPTGSALRPVSPPPRSPWARWTT